MVPTSNGVATINPNTIPIDSSPPRIHIESCSLEQREIPCNGSIVLPPGARDFEIKYTALTVVKPDQIQFSYRMDGLDRTWVNVGTRRTAYFSHLPAGAYRFSVAAMNTSGLWSAAARQQLGITVQPFYYQTLWFQSLAAAMITGLFLFAWRIRAAQYKKGQALQRAFAQQIIASQESERKRIAAELHDGLGQRLAVIKNMALLLNGSGDRDRHERSEAIAAETSEAINEVRRISRNLRPYQLDLLGLTKSLELLVRGTCEAAGMRADIVIDDLDGAFRKEAEIHFYRVVQECLSNIVKHSKASLATVLIHRTPGAISLVVSDNGVGFEPGRCDGNGGTGGFGLTGISERAKLLGGKATVQSSPGQGTAVTIEINSEN